MSRFSTLMVAVPGILVTFDAVFLNNEIYPWIIIVVMPINSLINPYIYSISEIVTFLKAKQKLILDEKSV